MRMIPRTCLLGLMAVALAGCSGTPAADGPPPSTHATVPDLSGISPSGGKLPYGGAPRVVNPLPVSVLSGDPCTDALTADQTRTIFGQVVRGERNESGAFGPTCDWYNTDTHAQATVTYDPSHDGLSSIYSNTKSQAVVWRTTTTQGFPAATHVTSADAVKGFCQVSVGIADDATVDIGVILGRTKVGNADPCNVTEQVAAMVIGNLKQKAGS